nr:thioredoxin M-type, chloroplastic-like [Tanacetum cinerariifolium]
MFKPSINLSASTLTSLSTPFTFNYRCSNRSRVFSKYSAEEVKVVTACSWTELVVAAEMPVLVLLWSPLCESCQMISSIIDEIAKEYTGKALCYQLNTDDYPNVASQYSIKSIPTMLFFKDGDHKETVTGVVPKSTLCNTLDKYVE